MKNSLAIAISVLAIFLTLTAHAESTTCSADILQRLNALTSPTEKQVNAVQRLADHFYGKTEALQELVVVVNTKAAAENKPVQRLSPSDASELSNVFAVTRETSKGLGGALAYLEVMKTITAEIDSYKPCVSRMEIILKNK
ncbi:MAG: hypothetical protein V4654_07805 [Bdellovibrionota bacterium]